MPEENGLILRKLLGIFHSECSKELDLSLLLTISTIGNTLDLPPFSGRNTHVGTLVYNYPEECLAP